MGENQIVQLAGAALLAVGVLFMLLGAVGLLRMPDVYMRTQAASKTSTLGVVCIFGAVALHFEEVGAATRAMAVVALALVTVPIGAHALARAAHIARAPLWPPTSFDHLREDLGDPESGADAERRAP